MSKKEPMNNERKFETMKSIFESNYHLISLADNKATAILTVNGIMLTVVLATVGLLGNFFDFENKVNLAAIVFFVAYLVSCLTSISFSIFTILPFQKTGIPDPRHVFYYVNILEYKDKDEYLKGLRGVLEDFSRVEEEYSEQIYAISVVNQRKYKNVKWCIWTLLSSLFLVGIFLSLTILGQSA
ncbi:MAG: hypothetical protein KGD59_04295 [Candidatus Heimdallarchaeota archaeon]|nr:hypothetical protein [Candidatus Heimdallarchaeota archaeon]MBY8993746.1 hypothetical protein [Candidatus Heimdallarchaeota archaeon]